MLFFLIYFPFLPIFNIFYISLIQKIFLHISISISFQYFFEIQELFLDKQTKVINYQRIGNGIWAKNLMTDSLLNDSVKNSYWKEFWSKHWNLKTKF